MADAPLKAAKAARPGILIAKMGQEMAMPRAQKVVAPAFGRISAGTSNIGPAGFSRLPPKLAARPGG